MRFARETGHRAAIGSLADIAHLVARTRGTQVAEVNGARATGSGAARMSAGVG